ncbi:MAG: hypothetical protein M3Q71_07110 [Chloroflexota bacterium]|nr:hypothetical protein [Chloroflexota bacterium]
MAAMVGGVAMRFWMLGTIMVVLVTLVLTVAIGLQVLKPPLEPPTPSLVEGNLRVVQVASVPPVVATVRAQVMEREPRRDGSRVPRVVTPTAEAVQ